MSLILDDFNSKLTQNLDKYRKKWQAQVAVRSPKFGIDYRYGAQDLPYHSASVGKLAPAALTLQLVEQKLISLDTPVASILDREILQGIFMEGKIDDVTIEQLLTHTSGANDYLNGPTKGDTLAELTVTDLDRRWTPASLLDYAREYQKPIGAPGQKFFYSDTGFTILGLLLEEVTGRAYSQLVHEKIFDPLGMTRSFMPLRTKPTVGDDTIAPLYLGKTRVDTAQSLTMDWAGGGLAATLDDYLTFIHALHTGQLISQESWEWMTRSRHKYRSGLYYGAGSMNVKFSGFVPWLWNFPRPVGHLGLTAVHLWYDAEHDAEIAINFGSSRAMQTSFYPLIEIVRLLRQLS
ncbi:serine hydrolase domain-containing protein [Streptococcus oricebi]|uniref:Beta-lactamase-related domain-containing protein n=1 Tax=Streptococcus oricebi TaxID=1547447 RepID=A0ABS5B418_9STRE|nr:serine hydrolase domain-containing protein [Streptococcus oricebi]MBP2622729.1 hypothetical protein [Streptococcus oricebi]